MWAGFRFIKTEVDDRAREAAVPTAAQAKAGNYRMGHANVGGLEVSIETPKGGQRKGIDRNGKPWSVTMPAHYGYVRGTQGSDGDHVDVSLGPDAHEAEQHDVYVIDQINQDGSFDEHKCQVGFASKAAAVQAYDSSFSDGHGPDRRGAVTTMPFAQFKDWLAHGDTKSPVAYGKVKKADDEEQAHPAACRCQACLDRGAASNAPPQTPWGPSPWRKDEGRDPTRQDWEWAWSPVANGDV